MFGINIENVSNDILGSFERIMGGDGGGGAGNLPRYLSSVVVVKLSYSSFEGGKYVMSLEAMNLDVSNAI